MKKLILLPSLLSLSTIACDFKNLSLGELRYPDSNDVRTHHVLLDSDYDGISKEKFINLPTLKDFSYNECRDALKKTKFINLKTGEVFTAIYTYEDSCDGGNSYGNILNSQSKIIGEIRDGDFQCFK